jgi:hypothetical protein
MYHGGYSKEDKERYVLAQKRLERQDSANRYYSTRWMSRFNYTLFGGVMGTLIHMYYTN